MRLPVRIIDNRLRGEWMPRYARAGDAGLDLRCLLTESFDLWPGEVRRVPTGMAIHIGDASYCGLVLPRSSMAARGVTVANSPGLIDSGYQGSLDVLLRHAGTAGRDGPIRIEPGDRIAQLVIAPVATPALVIVDEFQEQTERGESGFGSTGVA